MKIRGRIAGPDEMKDTAGTSVSSDSNLDLYRGGAGLSNPSRKT